MANTPQHIIAKRLVSALALVVWACFIFGFSGQNGGESGGLSARVAETLVSFGDLLTGVSTTGAALDAAVEALQFPIRKAAHMTEYAILAVLALAQLRLWPAFNGGLPSKAPTPASFQAEGEAASPTSSRAEREARSREIPCAPNGGNESQLRRAVGFAWGFAVLYAATDEVHQLFVPGRAALFTDVMIDATGAALGLLLAATIIVLRTQRRKRTP